MSNILGLWINNYLTTGAKQKLKYFNSAYNFNAQDDGAEMFFVIVKMVKPCSHAPTEVKNTTLSYPSIEKIMVESHCEIMWAENYRADLGCQPTENYAALLDDLTKQVLISQQSIMSNMLGLWIKKFITTGARCKLRTFRNAR